MSALSDLQGSLDGSDLVEELFDALGIWDSIEDSFGAFDKTYTSGYEYYLGLHVGVCHGPVDEILEVTFDGRTAWKGVAKPGQIAQPDPLYNLGIPTTQEDSDESGNTDPVTTPNLLAINKAHLFGGEKGTGGLLGIIDILWGGSTQNVNPYLQAKCGRRVPAYVGFLTAVLHANITSQKDYVYDSFWLGPIGRHLRRAKLSEPPTYHTGFYWGCMKPSVRLPAFKVFRSLEGWVGSPVFYPEKATITLSGVKHRNPAHIIYEILTNKVVGMKKPYTLIDDANFRSVADQLYSEGMGLSFLWTGTTTIEEFLSLVLQHIAGELFQNPATGLYNLYLIRESTAEEISASPLFTMDQIEELGELYQPNWSETVNDVALRYLSPNGEKIRTISDQNAVNLAVQGKTVPSTLQYYGIRDNDLAKRVLKRELLIASTPLRTISNLPLSRLAPAEGSAYSSAYVLHIGALVRLSIPQYNLYESVWRVRGISNNDLADSRIIVDLVEDVFSMPTSGDVGSNDEGWVDPVRPATEFPAENTKYAPLSYHTVLQMLGAAGATYLNPEYAGISFMADRPEGQDQITGITAYGADTDSIAAAAPISPKSMLCPTCLLDGALGVHDSGGNLITQFKVKNLNSLSLRGVVGSWGFLGDEKILCTAVDRDPDSPNYLLMTVDRGVLDTIPTAHPDGEKIWWFNDIAGSRVVGSVYLVGEQPYFWAVANSPLDEAGLTLTTPKFHPSLVADWYAPYPPANTLFEGVRFRDTVAAKFELQVSGRNRLTQSNQFLGWDEEGVEPESGTSLEVRVYDADSNALLKTVTGIPFLGPQGYFKYDGSAVASSIRIETQTVRNGVKSAQIASQVAKVCGWGWGYGCMYGGNSPRGKFLTVPGTVYDGSRLYESDKVAAPYPKYIGGRWWDFAGLDSALNGLQPGPGVQLMARVSSLDGVDGTGYHLPIVEGHPTHAAPLSTEWSAPPTRLQTVETLSYAWPTYKASIDSTFLTGRYGRVYRAASGQQRSSMSQVVAIPDAAQSFVSSGTAKLSLRFWFGTDVDATVGADTGRVYLEFLDQSLSVLSYVDTAATDLFDTGWLDAETDSLFLHDNYQGGRWRPVNLTVPANPANFVPANARYVRLTFLFRNVSSPECKTSFNLLSGRVYDAAAKVSDVLETATVDSSTGFPVSAKLQATSPFGWSVTSDGLDAWAISSAGRLQSLNLPVMLAGVGETAECTSISWTNIYGGSWLVNADAGAYLAVFADAEHPELFDLVATDVWSGGVSSGEPISSSATISWVGQLGDRILAVGQTDDEPPKACIYRSRKAVTDSAFVLGQFELSAGSLDIALSDIRNWVYYPPESRWYVFGTAGNSITGKLRAWRSTDAVTWTKVTVTSKSNTAKIGYPFLRRTGATTWAIELFGGAWVAKYDGAWTLTRATLNPLLMTKFATAGGAQWDPEDVSKYVADSSPDHNSILLRTGQIEWNSDAQVGSLGQYYAGATLGFDTLNVGQDLTAVTLVSPADHPYGKSIATCGDLSPNLIDAGYINNGMLEDVIGIYGRNTGSRYFEVVVSSSVSSTQVTPIIVVGLAVAAGPKETCKSKCSALLTSNGDVYTAARIKCPGSVAIGTKKVATGVRVNAGAVVGFKVNFAAKSVRVFLDGQLLTTVSGSTALDVGKIWYPVFTASGMMLTTNLGQKPFIFDPNTGGDSGYVGWI